MNEINPYDDGFMEKMEQNLKMTISLFILVCALFFAALALTCVICNQKTIIKDQQSKIKRDSISVEMYKQLNFK
jgi:hypothetical protein